MQVMLELTLVLLTTTPWAIAQVEPAATGPGGPLVNGDLSYSVHYAQTNIFYSDNQVNSGDQSAGIASADVEYVHPNERYPFHMDYGGGYMWSIAGQSLGSGVFQHVLASQGMVGRRWELTAADNFSYTPLAPTTGFSGVAGTGEPIGSSGSTSSQSILTINTRTLENSADVELQYKLNYATTLTGGGGTELLRYPTGNGLDSNGQEASVGISRRMNARNSFSGQYSYAHFSYDASPYSNGIAGAFGSSSLTVGYQRAWNRQFSTDISIGPEWISGSDQTLVPSSHTVAVDAGAVYQFRSESAGVRYDRGVNGSTGYLPGATVDIVTGFFSRTFERELTVGATGSYLRTTALQIGGGVTEARFGGAQVLRRLGSYLGFFASYTAIDQTSGLSNSTPQSNVLSQLYQVVSFGISLSSKETRLRK